VSPARLEVRGVSKRFGGLRAVEDVSLEIAVGERVGLIGPNGAGKTTLFGLIAGELDADAGEIFLEGRRIDELAPHKRARLGIGRTYQRLEVFPEMTVLDHLLFALSAHRGSLGLISDLLGRGRPSDDDLESAARALERVGLAGRANEVVGTLSLGTCRLVELARALVVSPAVLLADEPSSGLDSLESAELSELLVDLADSDGISVALVEHDLATVKAVSERVVVLDLGRIIALGSYDEVMEVDVVRRAYLGAQR
jgi:branched-chain amino acid transport system ATP-binding protein